MENIAALSGFLFLDAAEDRRDFVVGYRDDIENRAQLFFRLVGDVAVQTGDLSLDDVFEGDLLFRVRDLDHLSPRGLLDGRDVAD